MQNFFDYSENGKYNFENYNGKIVLKSNNEKTQAIFDKVLSVFDKNKNGKLDADEIKTIWRNFILVDKNGDGILTTDEVKDALKQNKTLSKLKMSTDDIINFIKIVNDTINKSFQKARKNTDRILMNILKQHYPENEYEYKKTYDNEDCCTIEVINKTTNKLIAELGSYKNGNYYMRTSETQIEYDKNGYIVMRFNKKTGKSNNYDPISDSLYMDITAKNKIGLPTTDKNFEKHINQINSENIMEILTNYKDNYGESLLDAINGEWGLDKDIKDRVIKYLNSCCIDSPYFRTNKPNAKIDDNFNQGGIGDCWFLSTISAIQRSPKGQDILNNIIKDNHDGTYTVKFKGADKPYTVSALEILSKSQFSDGDIDIKILEIAAEKHYNILGISHGGYPGSAYDLLLGTNHKWQNLVKSFLPKPSPQKIKDLLGNKNIVMTCTVHQFSKFFGVTKNPEAEYQYQIEAPHAYAVHDIDDKNIYLENPWDTSCTVAVPLDVFDEYWGGVQYVEIK